MLQDGIREQANVPDGFNKYTAARPHRQVNRAGYFSPDNLTKEKGIAESASDARRPDKPTRFTKQNIYISADSPANVSDDERRRPTAVSVDHDNADDRWSPLLDLVRADSRVRNSFLSMALLAVVSLFLGALAVQLLLRLTTRSASATNTINEAIIVSLPAGDGAAVAATSTSQRWDVRTDKMARGIIEHVAIALSAVVIVLDMCCLLTVSVQCFLTVQLIRKRADGTDR
jgi:hypothetical protein